MNKTILYNFNIDESNKKILIKRSFNAPLNLVWEAWTTPEILDLWWAPQPLINRTKSMDFRPGGKWIYSMITPEKDEYWAMMEYLKIELEKSFTANGSFCDEKGVVNASLPGSRWFNEFRPDQEQTVVEIELSFRSLEDLRHFVEMGFKEGFESGLSNLDLWLQKNNH
jgi:uncharacterized protein YndB with AHSA1/START domain